MKIVEPSVTLLSVTPNAEQLIERAGRVCYKSEDRITSETAGPFIKSIITRGHESVLEHAGASFLFVCDRGISHEIVRHRLCSFSQESTRYCNYGKTKFGSEISVIEPPIMSKHKGVDFKKCVCDECHLARCAFTSWSEGVLAAERSYFDLLSSDCQPQIARSVLPMCLKTEIVVTGNFRQLRLMFKLRGLNKAAHPQIRPLFNEALKLIILHAPNVFDDIREEA